nr:chitinase-like protein Idgf4 isoform X2 [Leptinotarsa decemlineata]
MIFGTRRLYFLMHEQKDNQFKVLGSVLNMAVTDAFKIILLFIVAYASYTKAESKVVCYYDSKAYFRTGQGKFDIPFLEPALQFCTHLIYGYAGINPTTNKIMPLNEKFDVNGDNYRHITELKRRFPGLRVLLSVGGGKDVSGEDKEKNMIYRTIIESVDSRLVFVNSAKDLVKNYGFDGLDLAWEFPETKPKKIQSGFKKFWSGLKHTFVSESVIDEKADEHREQFTAFVREFRNNFRHDGLLLTYDARQIAPHIDFVTLQNFDFYTPQRNPKEADYTAPLYELIDRKIDENGDYQVRYWLQNGMPNNKIIYGIGPFGRSFKMTDDSGITGVPPLTIDGPGEAGPYTEEPGLLSYNEVCSKIANKNEIKAGYVGKLRKVNDPTKRFGTYAFRLPKDDTDGVWVSFEDPDTAGQKASYVRAKGLGGIAIVDISLDDFRGLCTGDKYPILRAARYML